MNYSIKKEEKGNYALYQDNKKQFEFYPEYLESICDLFNELRDRYLDDNLNVQEIAAKTLDQLNSTDETI
ncbi:MAG: hypothetical protein ACFFD1_07090 [Candidatus Thorarchaeota archaeon]